MRQYQVQLDPDKLRAYGISLMTISDRVQASTNEVGGRVLELSDARYMIRGLGYLHSLSDLEDVPVAAEDGPPVLLRDLGTVAFGPDIREGAVDWQGEGETVGGIVVMRYGMNALTVIDDVKKQLAEIKPSLPRGVEVVPAYDRSGLIRESIKTLQRDLVWEAVIVSVVTLMFLFHVRSALIPILSLPIAVLASFIPMYYLRVSNNMSLGGLALAIGVLVDAAIVMVENGYRHLSEREGAVSPPAEAAFASGAAQTPPALTEPERRRSWLRAPNRSVQPSSFPCSSSWSPSCRCFFWKRRKGACFARSHGPRRCQLASLRSSRSPSFPS